MTDPKYDQRCPYRALCASDIANRRRVELPIPKCTRDKCERRRYWTDNRIPTRMEK